MRDDALYVVWNRLFLRALFLYMRTNEYVFVLSRAQHHNKQVDLFQNNPPILNYFFPHVYIRCRAARVYTLIYTLIYISHFMCGYIKVYTFTPRTVKYTYFVLLKSISLTRLYVCFIYARIKTRCLLCKRALIHIKYMFADAGFFFVREPHAHALFLYFAQPKCGGGCCCCIYTQWTVVYTPDLNSARDEPVSVYNADPLYCLANWNVRWKRV